MTINVIHVSDIHLGSGEGHGRVNPQTGLNSRFEDFVRALTQVVDYTIANKADIFLFSGDAYRTSSPEPIYQKVFAKELKRLSDASIQTILLTGNHDLILRSTASHSMSVFQSLEVPNVTVIDKPKVFTLDTAHGACQIVGLPYVTRHHLMSSEEFSSMGQVQIDKAIVEKVSAVMRGLYDELDDKIPTLVTAHMTLDKAIAGIEKELLVGYTQTFPSDIFVDPRIDFVALGHVHKHQVIRDNTPPIVYAGSLDRIDFGEEKEDKGFLHIELNRGSSKFEFHSISPRPFVTVDCDVTNSEDPTKQLLQAIKEKIKEGCVLRVRYKIKQEQTAKLNVQELEDCLKQAMSARLIPEIVFGQRLGRIPELNETSVSTPLSALESYLDQVAPERKEKLLERAKQLLDD
ncbi:MAG: exonuclease SbcCD subunit D [Candidatus Obscuribacterales bacterium]|nr:exonuclease SbcCD subunit D [Candidatus Obscuribacterales bacterium]